MQGWRLLPNRSTTQAASSPLALHPLPVRRQQPGRQRKRRQQNCCPLAQQQEGDGALAGPTPLQPGSASGEGPLDYASLLGNSGFGRSLALNPEMLQQLLELPGTKGMADLMERATSLQSLRTSLRKGILPRADTLDWPAEPFRSSFLKALGSLEMARFCRRHPKLLDSLTAQMLEMVREFETKLAEMQDKQQQKQQQQQQQQGQSGTPTESMQGGEEGEAGGDAQPQEFNPEDLTPEQIEQALKDLQQGKGGSGQSDFDISLEDLEGEGQDGDQQGNQGEEEGEDGQPKDAEELTDKIIEEFKQEWSPAMEALETAAATFDDLDGLMEGPDGFDLSRALWHSSGWRELEDLRTKLADLRELRDLVRSLGRGGGKGPKRRAPEQVSASKKLPGVIRSSLQPEETSGLTRSGDLSRMLPMEMHLLAAGWPRDKGQTEVEPSDGNRAARLLHMVRRAERGLMSYDRTGWLEDEPSKLTGRMEIRPAAELGPIIVCLDTSGSMRGARETVAKALALECMRGAHRQERKCFLYAFSGPGDVIEMELSVEAGSLERLLDFLRMSFDGGTDVDRPLELSLERLGKEEWAQADILMVTDGEINSPCEETMDALRAAQLDLGLEVHGLIVAPHVTPAMQDLCTHVHVFKSWSTVGGSAYL